MELKSLLAMSLVCAMGAISPGPSLSVVMRNTISGGRREGVMTGFGHGIGLGIYAFIAVMGLSSLILSNEKIFGLLQFTGAIFLVMLSLSMVISSNAGSTNGYRYGGNAQRGFIEGFMIAFLNPKILVFFVAVFSQFLEQDMTVNDRFTMAAIAGFIDTLWYVMVAMVLAGTTIIDKMREHSHTIDRIVGTILFIFGIIILINLMDFSYFDL